MKVATIPILGLFMFCLSVSIGFAQTQDTKQLQKGQLIEVPFLNQGKTSEASESLINQKSILETVIFEEDFESGLRNWNATGSWAVGEPEIGPEGGYISNHAAGTNLTGNYPDNEDQRLSTPSISLPSISESESITLQFMEWFEIESGYDYGYVEISTDDGASWSTLSTRDGFSEWRETELDLTPYAGEDILLSFRFSSDYNINYAGWFIDDVEIIDSTTQPLSAEITSLRSQGFPLIVSNVRIDTLGAGFPDLTRENFTVYENGVLQTDLFNVTPPEQGGGVRRADIVFLMDNSGSMDDEQDAVEANVFDFVNNLEDSNVDYALGLTRYGSFENSGDPIIEDNGSLTSDTEYFKNDMWMRNRSSGGDEPGYYSITEAANSFNFRPGSQRIFIIITDESPDQGGASLNDALNELDEGDISLFALTETSLFSEFEPLTEATGGQFFDIYSSFSEILDFISTQVAGTYVVRYRSSNPEFDGTTRTVRIVAEYNGNTASSEATYIPGAAPSIQRTNETLTLSNEAQPDQISIPIEARITDDIEPGVQQARLFYKPTQNPVSSYTSVEMTNTSENIYRAEIPGSAVEEPGMDYYISATDGNTTSTSPSTNPGADPFQIAILPNYKPDITHTPVTEATVDQPVDITFSAKDNTRELESVKLFYRRVGQLNYEVEIIDSLTNESDFQLSIPSEFVTVDGLEYYIEAEDDWGLERTMPDNDPVDEPYSVDVKSVWPEVEGPKITFKIESSSNKIDRVVLYGGFTSDVQLTKVNNNFFIADGITLENLVAKSTGVRLYNSENKIVGHMPFKYSPIDFTQNKRIDAILFVHSEENLQPNLKDYRGWNYYSITENPVSMLIPPGRDYSSINEARKPLLMVHGVSGFYPYWGSNMIDDLNNEYDTWQFFYPYDQQIEMSAPLLSKAIEELTSSGGLANYTTLENRVNVVAHSMGGLVTRSYIQSEHYQGNINKFLMLGTPNYGSHTAYRFYYKKIAGTLGWIVGKDKNAPAYKQMTIGSKFLHDLNQSKPKELFPHQHIPEQHIRNSYLVVAGTVDFFIGLPHEEISDQDDGLVSVSSASLLNYNVPLATVSLAHARNGGDNLYSNTGDIILGFLNGLFDENNNPNNGISEVGITGFWLNNKDQPLNGLPNGVNVSKGIMTLRIPGSTQKRIPIERNFTAKISEGNDCNSQLSLGKQEHSTFSVLTPIAKPQYYLQNIDGSSNYFSLNTKGVNDLGFGFPQGCYRVKAFKTTDSLNYGSFGEFDQTIEFKHLQTSMDTIYYSSGQLAISNSNSFISSLNSSSAKTSSNKSNSIREIFNVDASVDSLTFWLSRFEGQDSHGLQLVSPSGSVIDSTIAKEAPGMEFKQNQSAGFAFYYLENPEAGTWAVQYNESLEGAVLSAPVISDIDTEINFTYPDSAYVIGNEIEFDITVDSESCTNPQFTATLYNQNESRPVETVGRVSLTSQNNGGSFKGFFIPEKAGTYYVESNFKCTKNGETVQRISTASTVVSGSEIPEELPDQVTLNQNYPNPFSNSTTVTYSIPNEQHVTLTVYNLLGRKVATLVDEQQEAAKHYVTFNAREMGLASGIYIYRLVTEEQQEAQKMTYIR